MQRAFVREYIKDYCGFRAAVRAGYASKSARSQAYSLLTRPHIQDAIAREEKKLQNRFYTSKEKILKELALIGFSDLSEYIEVDDQGIPRVNEFRELPTQASRALKGVKYRTKTTRYSKAGEDQTETTVQTEIVLHDKIAALVSMGKELGMFKDKCEHTGKDGAPIKIQDVSDEELLRILTRGSIKGNAKAQAGTDEPA
jgi:phage terminase small subunit